ncbi:four helix bundle protein [Patescibacteria group bacterium]|nr:four helix bundle protein [Patescibacteria group bacterium]
MKYLELNDISSYKKSLALSNFVWQIAIKWNHFKKQTVGIQFCKAMDSISASIAEGFGRYGKRDKIKFYHYSLYSAKESLDWNEKSKNRNLISKKQYNYLLEELKTSQEKYIN